MIDLILFSFVCGVFYAGFRLGAKYSTLKAMFSRVAAWFGESETH